MPRSLLSLSEWKVLKIDINDARCGDILFLANKNHPKFISHAAMVLAEGKIFHCCPSFGTAVIQSQKDFFASYEQRLNFKEMVRYIDPRDHDLRNAQKGIFILDA